MNTIFPTTQHVTAYPSRVLVFLSDFLVRSVLLIFLVICVVLCCVCVCVFVFVLSNVFSSVSVLSILGCPFGFLYILFTDIYIHRYSKKIQTFKMVYVLLLDT
jgi:uncharacterized membrane protein